LTAVCSTINLKHFIPSFHEFYNEMHTPLEYLGTIWYFFSRQNFATMCATVSQYANAKVYGKSAFLSSRYYDYLITCKKHQFIKISFLC